MAAWTVIDHTEAGTGGVAYWEESSIASSYDHLLVRASVRSELSGYIVGGIAVNLNGDTGSNYTYVSLESQVVDTPTSGGGGSSQTYSSSGAIGGTSILAETFTAYEMWLPNYANSSYSKQMIVTNSIVNNSSTDAQWYTYLGASLYHPTAAIHTVKLSINAGDDFAEFSTFTLYGVTGA